MCVYACVFRGCMCVCICMCVFRGCSGVCMYMFACCMHACSIVAVAEGVVVVVAAVVVSSW